MGQKTYRRALTPFHLRACEYLVPYIRSSQKNLIHAFSGHWPLFFAFFVDTLAIFCAAAQIEPAHPTLGARIVPDALKKCGFHPAGADLHFI